MKANSTLDLITNDKDLAKIKTDKVRHSSVFNKKKISQNKNNNTNNTKVSLYIFFRLIIIKQQRQRK